jgi:hemerythrin superfamily protein
MPSSPQTASLSNIVLSFKVPYEKTDTKALKTTLNSLNLSEDRFQNMLIRCKKWVKQLLEHSLNEQRQNFQEFQNLIGCGF